MKTVLLAKDLKSVVLEKSSFLNREHIAVLMPSTNDEILKMCRTEVIDLIITQLEMPGMRTEELFKIIRNSKELQAVSTIIICKDTLANRERCRQCSPNAVVMMPVDAVLLHMKVQQFLNVEPRIRYRAALAIAIEGKFKNTPLQFWTENLSISGMLIRAEEPLVKGNGIFFSFFLPDGAHVSGYGEITRVEHKSTSPDAFLYGVKFTNISPSVRSAIEAVVKR